MQQTVRLKLCRGHDGAASLDEARQAALFRKYLVSTDHKVIGLQYAFTSLRFPAGRLPADAAVIRWQLA